MRPSSAIACRRRLVAGVALIGVALVAVAAVRASTGDRRDQPARVVVADGSRVLLALPLAPFFDDGRLDRRGLARALRERLPATATVRRGRAVFRMRIDAAQTVARALRVSSRGARITVARTIKSVQIGAPVLRQAERNTCESAALEILLATVGIDVDQQRLQRELPRSGPLDPAGEGDERVWGDPDLGYVGRSDGGGPAGGFGVYPGPIARVAAAHGAKLTDLSGGPPSDVYASLRAGNAVMVWIGLSEGPYGRWRSPAGRLIEVNFGEHTVVLTGLTADGSVRVSNPLQGSAETWSPEKFETMWERLGRRALRA